MNEFVLFGIISALGMLVQSTVGFAGSLFAVPLFAFFLEPKEAIPASVIVMLLINILLIFESREHVQWKKLDMLLLGGVLGIPIGAYGLVHFPTYILRIIIGTLTIIFAVLFFFNVKINLKDTKKTRIFTGLISGVLSGSISSGGPPLVIFGISQAWGKNIFRANLLAYFFFIDLISTITFFYFGLLSLKTLKFLAVAMPPTILASLFGIFLKNLADERLFRKIVLTIIIFVGALSFLHR